jgi:hypothetical protein
VEAEGMAVTNLHSNFNFNLDLHGSSFASIPVAIANARHPIILNHDQKKNWSTSFRKHNIKTRMKMMFGI